MKIQKKSSKISKFVLFPAPVVVALCLLGAISLLPVSRPDATPPDIPSGTINAMTVKDLPEKIKLSKAKLRTVYQSPALETDFAFNAVAPTWKQSNVKPGDSVQLKMRVSDDKQAWSEWIEVEAGPSQNDEKPTTASVFPETPIMLQGKFLQYQLTLKRKSAKAASPTVSDLNVHYLNSEAKTNALDGVIPTASAATTQGKSVISRASWGSPDPYGTKYRTSASKFWAAEHHDLSQVFIHHTVNQNKPSDPSAVVRAIWHYHAVTLGWGDIGYNYLVDHRGNIYEGRWGGEGVQAGHVEGYNAKSLGVSLLGCFDTSSACRNINGGSASGPSTAALNSLTSLLAWKMTTHKIPPTGTHRFCGTSRCINIPRISGHRDAGGTSCPGNLFYEKLPSIRHAVAKKMKYTDYLYAAEPLSHDTLKLGGVDEIKNFTVAFKNTGERSWYRQGTAAASLIANGPNGRLSKFRNAAWDTDQRIAWLNEDRVRPGETGTFTLPFKRPRYVTNTDYFESFKLNIQDKGTLTNSYVFRLDPMTFDQLYRWEKISLNTYTDETKTTEVDPGHLTVGEPIYASLVAKNIGIATWFDEGKQYAVHLATANPRGRSSDMCHSSWLRCDRVTGLKNDVVAGDQVEINFWLQPTTAGEFDEVFSLVVTDAFWMDHTTVHLSGTVN